MILGIDEAGRGPWAGPLTVGAVVLGGESIDGLTDSKKLAKKRREQLSAEIHAKATAVGIGWATAEEIDSIGLGPSLTLATKRAVNEIKVPYSEIIIDGTVNFLKATDKGRYVTTIKKADLLIPSVSAAAIVAKVARDRFMATQDEVYPGYGFYRHAGYGTAAHRAAIESLGVTPLHRLSFGPLKRYQKPAGEAEPMVSKASAEATTTLIGNKAEDAACRYLVRLGHEILDRNWRTKLCEIDIVSTHKGTVYFTEVKYRRTPFHGTGFDAVTTKKLRQMTFASEYYIQSHKLAKCNRRLAVASVSGQPPELEAFLALD